MPAITDFVTLGRSGLRVSPLCLGAMTFGTEWGIGVGADESFKLIDQYLDAGGNFIDTANIYNKGASEKIIGDYFKNKGGGTHPARDRTVIATKWLGNLYRNDPNGGGSHRKALMESVNQSLRRLQTDYIDLLWLHFWDRHTPIEETMRGLDDLVSSGKVLYIGFSDTPAWKVAQAQTIAHFRGWAPLIALQIEYSLLERTVEGELLPMAREMGLGVTPWSPLKGGILTGKYTRDGETGGGRYQADSHHLTEKTHSIVDALREIAAQHTVQGGQASPAHIALAWVRQRSGVSSTIIGARSAKQLDANLASLEVTLSQEQMNTLDELSKPELNFPHNFLQVVSDTIQNGTTINGRASNIWGGSPVDDSEQY